MDGKTHGLITVTLVPAAAGIVGVGTGVLTYGVAAAIGCAFGLLLEPDLDVDHITASENRLLTSKWLWLFGGLWFLFWLPYAKLMPHRSFFSHFPIVGTAIRLAYLILPVLGVLWIIGVTDNPFALLMRLPDNFLLWFFYGLVVSDLGHWVADWSIWRR